ncbi:g10109 [Coccomyxa elongata]
MGRSALASLVWAVLLFTTVTGYRGLSEAAPAPSASLEQEKSEQVEGADVTFFLTAEKATFPTATTLVLQRPAATVASFQAGGRSAGERTAAFASAAPGARFVDGRGQWLGQPDALLQGSANGAQSDVLLTLLQPVYDAAAQTLTFTVAVLPPVPSSAKLSGGVVSRRIAQYEVGVGSALVQVVEPGMVLDDAAMFIDQNSAALQKPAELKFGWGGSDNSINFGGGGSGSPPPSGR